MSSSGISIEEQIEGFALGADMYIAKPFHPKHLEIIVDRLSSISENIHAADKKTSLTDSQLKEWDKDYLLKLNTLIEDNIENENLSPSFICYELAVSRMQLYRKLKELVNQSPGEYIRNVKLNPAMGFKIYNKGINGDTIKKLLLRWQEDCLDLKPTVISILAGVNDYIQVAYACVQRIPDLASASIQGVGVYASSPQASPLG